MPNNLKLINMSDVEIEEIDWIWHPYIPYGKVTIIQGDPGEGKTTFILALIALLTTGEPLPEEEVHTAPINVIYQTAEDGLGDTIKPRLVAAQADCERVLVIDENEIELTLSDERLEAAITQTGAKLIVLDPMQAYLGSEVDMHRANEIRPIMKRLALLAERTGCAVVLVGHMNKAQGGKAAYRGLGSIDFRAAARSVLIVGRSKDDPTMRIVAHDKSSLAPVGQSIAFALDPDNGFLWKGYCDTSVDDVLSGRGTVISKTERAEEFLREALADGDVLSDELFKRAKALDIAERTLKTAKQALGIKSVKRDGKWYYHMTQTVAADGTVIVAEATVVPEPQEVQSNSVSITPPLLQMELQDIC
ncbi:MAG: AAA family ATPase [Faecalibacterium sp.]